MVAGFGFILALVLLIIGGGWFMQFVSERRERKRWRDFHEIIDAAREVAQMKAAMPSEGGFMERTAVPAASPAKAVPIITARATDDAFFGDEDDEKIIIRRFTPAQVKHRLGADLKRPQPTRPLDGLGEEDAIYLQQQEGGRYHSNA